MSGCLTVNSVLNSYYLRYKEGTYQPGRRTFVEGARSTREGNLRQCFNPLTSPAGG